MCDERVVESGKYGTRIETNLLQNAFDRAIKWRRKCIESGDFTAATVRFSLPII